MIDSNTLAKVLHLQKDEITEQHIYKKIAGGLPKGNNRQVLDHLAADELRHYTFWKKFSKKETKPNSLMVSYYFWISKLFGLNFGLHLLQRTEQQAQDASLELQHLDTGVEDIIAENNRHEEDLLKLINQKHLQHTGAIVLGLNDALVELTGALAGLTLAFQNTRLIALAGLITGIAASLSMAASAYLSKKEEGASNPFESSLYTGFAYIFAVTILVAPYFLLKNSLIALLITIISALLIIAVFNFYISVAKNLSFKKKFLQMALISLGVAALNFIIGILVRKYIHI